MYFLRRPMANVLPLEKVAPRSRTTSDVRELAHALDLIEDRPETVLTWSDVARYARLLARRLEAALISRLRGARARRP
jgi:transcriptional regulator GlxA family with amidase domain